MSDIRPGQDILSPESVASPTVERNRQVETLVNQVFASRLTPQGVQELKEAQGNVDLPFRDLHLFRQIDDTTHLNEGHPNEQHYHIGFRHESDAKIIEANVAYSQDSTNTTPLSADFSNHSAAYGPQPELQGTREIEEATAFLRTSGVI